MRTSIFVFVGAAVSLWTSSIDCHSRSVQCNVRVYIYSVSIVYSHMWLNWWLFLLTFFSLASRMLLFIFPIQYVFISFYWFFFSRKSRECICIEWAAPTNIFSTIWQTQLYEIVYHKRISVQIVNGNAMARTGMFDEIEQEELGVNNIGNFCCHLERFQYAPKMDWTRRTRSHDAHWMNIIIRNFLCFFLPFDICVGVTLASAASVAQLCSALCIDGAYWKSQ